MERKLDWWNDRMTVGTLRTRDEKCYTNNITAIFSYTVKRDHRVVCFLFSSYLWTKGVFIRSETNRNKHRSNLLVHSLSHSPRKGIRCKFVAKISTLCLRSTRLGVCDWRRRYVRASNPYLIGKAALIWWSIISIITGDLHLISFYLRVLCCLLLCWWIDYHLKLVLSS